MGIVAKQQTKKLIQPRDLPIGPWLERSLASDPTLSRHDLLYTAALAALLRTNTTGITSSTLGTGKHTSAQINASMRRAVLRAEQTANSNQVALGTYDGLGVWHRDWLITLKAPDGVARVEVTDYRTREDGVPNRKLIDELVGTLAMVLQDGPHIEATDGLPSGSDLLVETVLPREMLNGTSKSPFANDYLLPPAAPFVSGARIELPPGSLRLVDETASVLGIPRRAVAGQALHALDLSGGRTISADLLLDSSVGAEALVFVSDGFGSAGPMSQHRTFRAAMSFVVSLARSMREQQPSVSDALLAGAERFGDDPADAGRNSRFLPLWTSEIPSQAIPVRPSEGLPIAVKLQLSSDPQILQLLRVGQSWLAARQRTWSRGMTRRSRESNRINITRRPFVIQQNDTTLPYLRYGRIDDTDAGGFYRADTTPNWFWEMHLKRLPPPTGDGAQAGRFEALLSMSGLGHSDGVIAYGTELLTMFRSVGHVVSSADSGATFTTYRLRP